jgi:hypothetical protein
VSPARPLYLNGRRWNLQTSCEQFGQIASVSICILCPLYRNGCRGIGDDMTCFVL